MRQLKNIEFKHTPLPPPTKVIEIPRRNIEGLINGYELTKHYNVPPTPPQERLVREDGKEGINIPKQSKGREKEPRNCKGDINAKEENTNTISIKRYVYRFISFLFITVIGLPIAIPMLVYFLFKNIVLNESVDAISTLIKLGKRLKKASEEDEEFTDENYELTEVEDITK